MNDLSSGVSDEVIKCEIKDVEAGLDADQLCDAYGSSRTDVFCGSGSVFIELQGGAVRYVQTLRARQHKNNFREPNNTVPSSNDHSKTTQESQDKVFRRGCTKWHSLF